MVKINRVRNGRVMQGDIVKDVEHIEYASVKGGVIEVSTIVFPLIVVLAQDCDLEQDFKFRCSRSHRPSTHDKYLLSVLVAPLYNAEHVYLGEHLSELQLKMEPINNKRTPGTYLQNNERPRFHYIDFPASVQVVRPSLISSTTSRSTALT